MSRFHIHMAVSELESSIGFYTAIFGEAPSGVKDDYARCELAEPDLNFAISLRDSESGIDHLGIQVHSDLGLNAMCSRLEKAGITGTEQEGATCCYARSDRFWTVGPQGVSWETFHTLESAHAMSCQPDIAPKQDSSCCASGTTDC